MSFKKKLRRWQEILCEIFWNFESANGAFIFIPWGAGLVYFGIYDAKMGYRYAMVSGGIALIAWGIRKVSVNRIKYWNKIEAMQERRKNRVGS